MWVIATSRWISASNSKKKLTVSLYILPASTLSLDSVTRLGSWTSWTTASSHTRTCRSVNAVKSFSHTVATLSPAKTTKRSGSTNSTRQSARYSSSLRTTANQLSALPGWRTILALSLAVQTLNSACGCYTQTPSQMNRDNQPRIQSGHTNTRRISTLRLQCSDPKVKIQINRISRIQSRQCTRLSTRLAVTRASERSGTPWAILANKQTSTQKTWPTPR